jgi:hypothetical protein
MASAQGPGRREGRPRAKTPAERAEEAAEVQRRLKREAAERREASAGKQGSAGRRDAGSLPARKTAAARRRTP